MGSYEVALEALNSVVKGDPELKDAAAKKLEELNVQLTAGMIARGISELTIDPLAKIKNGVQRFKSRFAKEEPLFKALAESQHPKFMIFACSDSRVDPAVIFGLDVGEAFVVRNIASLVPPYSKTRSHASGGSAIEYAVLHLKVEHILIIGHSRCGGMKALMDMKDDGSDRFSEFIEDWISIAQSASKTVRLKCGHAAFEEQWAACAKEAVNTSISNCLTYPFVKDGVEQGTLSLHGGYYDFVKGEFEDWAPAAAAGDTE